MEVFPNTAGEGVVLRPSHEHRREADAVAGTYGDPRPRCVADKQISEGFARSQHGIEVRHRNGGSTLKSSAGGVEEAGRDDFDLQIAAAQGIVSPEAFAVALRAACQKTQSDPRP